MFYVQMIEEMFRCRYCTEKKKIAKLSIKAKSFLAHCNCCKNRLCFVNMSENLEKEVKENNGEVLEKVGKELPEVEMAANKSESEVDFFLFLSVHVVLLKSFFLPNLFSTFDILFELSNLFRQAHFSCSFFLTVLVFLFRLVFWESKQTAEISFIRF